MMAKKAATKKTASKAKKKRSTKKKAPPRQKASNLPREPLAPADADLSHILEGLRPLAGPIDQLVPDPSNARKHPERNLDVIRGSLARFGQRTPLVVNRTTNVVEKGNGTLAAARSLNWTYIAWIYVDHDPTTATAYSIADNRSAELAEWDDDALAKLLQSLDDEILDFTGFDTLEVESILDGIEDAPTSDDPELDATSKLDDQPEFRIIVICRDEKHQHELYNRFRKDGLKATVITSCPGGAPPLKNKANATKATSKGLTNGTANPLPPPKPGRDPGDVSYISPELRHLAIPIENVSPDPANARAHPDRNREVIRGSLARFGQLTPIVVNKPTGIVEKGNGTLEEARRLGWPKIAALYSDDDPSTATAYAIADNRAAELASWDETALAELATPLDDAARMATGFDLTELDELVREASGEIDLKPASADNASDDPKEYRVVILCDDEEHQRDLAETLEAEGLECQMLMS